MPKAVLTEPAALEIEAILDWSQANFGELSRLRYAALLKVAINDVASDTSNPLIRWKRHRRGNVGFYHIEHSKTHVDDPPGQVNKPRHLLVIRIDDSSVYILNVVHDSQNIARKLGAIRA